MSYNLDKDRDHTWIGASLNSQIFYGSKGQCYVYDEQLGIINLHSKESLLEYHVLDKNIDCLACFRLNAAEYAAVAEEIVGGRHLRGGVP